MQTLFELFFSFLKVGFTSFGGVSMVPLINSEMLSHGWMTAQEVSDIVAIAEMTPGPLGMNCSTFAGIRVAGVPGAAFAMLGILFPTLTLTFAAVIFFQKFRESTIMQRALYGIRPAGIGLVFATMYTLGRSNYFQGTDIHPASVLIGIVISLIIWKKNTSVPKTIVISAVLGLLLIR
ncbi:MAG: chromate transporter [Clostridiales bacterium]|nr:chromate transporter [Clostridiales bacterium]